MTKNSLNNLLRMFPYFLSKDPSSNFYKSQSVTNEQFKNISNDLHKIYRSFHLNKRCLIWKEQDEDYNYKINFAANYPNLKSVRCFKGDKLIHSEDYSEEEAVDSFEYQYKHYTFVTDEWTPTEDTDVVVIPPLEGDDLAEVRIIQGTRSGYVWADMELTAPYFIKFKVKSINYYRLSFMVKIGNDNYFLELPDDITEGDEILIQNTEDTFKLWINDEYKGEIGEDTPGGLIPVSTSDNIHNIGFYLSNRNDKLFFEYFVPKEIIPTTLFSMIIETYDEYTIEKGFPENDVVQGNIYDHDESLDEIGALHNIPRKEYVTVDEAWYPLTEPPYNDRLSEDDYHYMKRILNYMLRLHTTSPPVLELWKLYGLDCELVNRERLLLKMFDEDRHEEDWVPMEWEHKDSFCDYNTEFGTYFFVKANTLQPIEGVGVILSFKFINSLAEDLVGDYQVEIRFNDEIINEDKIIKSFQIPSDILSPSEDNVFTITGLTPYGEIISTKELIIRVKGCNTADYYVNPTTGDDINNNGKSYESPYRTIEKALTRISSDKNLINLSEGIYQLSDVLRVNSSCTLLGCPHNNESAILLNENSNRFFNLSSDVELTIKNLILKTGDDEHEIEYNVFQNSNRNKNSMDIRVYKEGSPILYQPAFMGDDQVITQMNNLNAYSASNGVARFKGAVLSEGWDNTGLWKCTFELAYLDGLRYTGLVLLTNLDTPFSGWGIRNWEGPITSNPSGNATYTKTPNITLSDLSGDIYNNPVVDWHNVSMEKTSPTTLEVWKNYDVENKVVYEWEELSDIDRVTIGGVTNTYGGAAGQYGSTFIRNLLVVKTD